LKEYTMTRLQKILFMIFVFLISAGYLGWFGTNPFWIGLFGMGLVIVIFVEDFLSEVPTRQQ